MLMCSSLYATAFVFINVSIVNALGFHVVLEAICLANKPLTHRAHSSTRSAVTAAAVAEKHSSWRQLKYFNALSALLLLSHYSVISEHIVGIIISDVHHKNPQGKSA